MYDNDQNYGWKSYDNQSYDNRQYGGDHMGAVPSRRICLQRRKRAAF